MDGHDQPTAPKQTSNFAWASGNKAAQWRRWQEEAEAIWRCRGWIDLEGIAEPGGISISDDARRQIRGKVDITFEDLGSQSLKNIAEPMRVWRVPNSRAVPAVPTRLRVDNAALTLPEKTLHRCSALYQHERRPRAGIFCRRDS